MDSPSATNPPAIVLCIGGHDPSTAGIQADIETAAAFDCLALTVVSAWTTQNTSKVHFDVGQREDGPEDDVAVRIAGTDVALAIEERTLKPLR